jgi:hypothetical protein
MGVPDSTKGGNSGCAPKIVEPRKESNNGGGSAAVAAAAAGINKGTKGGGLPPR